MILGLVSPILASSMADSLNSVLFIIVTEILKEDSFVNIVTPQPEFKNNFGDKVYEFKL